jgi:hypothetical protein
MTAPPWTRLTWVEIANGGDHIHPNWTAAVERAAAAGFGPNDLTGVQVTGASASELPRLVFGERMVTPRAVWVFTLEERGDGDPI